MSDEMKKNAPYDPATDEQIEYWQVQVEYGDKPVVGPIERGAFGSILARLAKAEEDRDQARRAISHVLSWHETGSVLRVGPLFPTTVGGSPEEVREVCAAVYGEDEARRLFP